MAHRRHAISLVVAIVLMLEGFCAQALAEAPREGEEVIATSGSGLEEAYGTYGTFASSDDVGSLGEIAAADGDKDEASSSDDIELTVQTEDAGLGGESFIGIGAGTKDNPYLISTEAELDAMRYQLDACYALTNDIEMTAGSWVPVGSKANPFCGSFDGAGFQIKGLTIDETVDLNDSASSTEHNYGLFGYAKDAKISGLGLEDIDIDVSMSSYDGDEPPFVNVGSLIGEAYDTSVSQCSVTGSISLVAGKNVWTRVGGLCCCGRVDMDNCSVRSSLSGVGESFNTMVGGFSAYLVDSHVSNSFFEGALVGQNPGVVYVGGINASGEYPSVSSCLAIVDTGDITAIGNRRFSDEIGNFSNKSNCRTLSPNDEACGDQSTYIALGWDCENVWLIEGNRPILRTLSDGGVSQFNDTLIMYDEGNHPTNGTWSDRWFAFGSSGYNHELATTASILASAAYNGNQTNESEFAISKDYDALGFKKKAYRNYGNEGADSVGVSFATRDASFGNEEYPVVIAAIRGTSNDNEWISNLNVNNTGKGTTDLHEGFNAAADEVIGYLEQYLIDNSILTTNTRILVTGHSRGAAVANLVAYKLDKGSIDSIRKDNVYAYTFATPNTSTQNDVSDVSFDNIFNIVNPEDIVARVPLVGWGFGKYGKTLYLPSKSNCSDFKSYRSAMQDIYAGYTSGDYYNSYATGTWRSRVLATTVLATSPNVWCYYNLRHVSPYRLIPPFSATLHEVAECIWTKGGGTALSKAIGYPAYMSLVSTILAEEGIEMLVGATSSPGSMGWIKTEVTDGHRPATYVAWMQSGSSIDLFKDAYYGLSVACPVDIKVYDDSGSLVASIVDGQVDESLIEDGLAAYVDGDAKCVDIPKDANYRVEATASATGTMDIAWKEMDADGETISQTCYNDLKLTEGQSYDIDLTSNRGSGTNDTIDVTNPGGTSESADYTTGSWDAGSLSVEVATEGNGDALGVAGATRGDQVTVVATPYEGESFLGWYEGKTMVCPDEEYSFRIEDSRSLTARFTDSGISTVAVDSITVTASRTTLKVGESATITVNVYPENAINKDVAFSSSDSSVVTVTSAGKVTGKKAGTARVTVTSTSNGSATKTIAFKVTAKKVSISTAKVSGVSAKTYTGKKLTQKLTVKVGNKTLKAGTDYTLSYKNNVKVGTATVTITGKGSYIGAKTIRFMINKAKQPMTAKGKSKTLSMKSLRKKTATAKKLIAVKKAKGKVTYKNASSTKTLRKFKVNAKNGTVTVPRGTKRGTYKVKVKVVAKGNASYKSGSKTVTIIIKVK